MACTPSDAKWDTSTFKSMQTKSWNAPCMNSTAFSAVIDRVNGCIGTQAISGATCIDISDFDAMPLSACRQPGLPW